MNIVTAFFFSSRRRHTRWPRDWSSDVCSSDLENFLLVRGSVKSIVLFTKGDFNNAGQGDLVCRQQLFQDIEKNCTCALLNCTFGCNHRSSRQPLRPRQHMHHTLVIFMNSAADGCRVALK